jgi:predicted secreted protein
MSQALAAFGTFIQRGDGATPTESFTTIAEVSSISGPQMSAKIDDVTTHSTGTPWRAKLATLLDAGTVAFNINFIPSDATHSYVSGLLLDFANRTKRNFKIIFPDGVPTTWSVTAYVQDFKIAAPVDGILSASMTLNVSGPPVLA